MSFAFVYVCDLLDDLYRLVHREDYILPKELSKKSSRVITQWFGSHCAALDELDYGICKGSDEVLAILQPEKRMIGHNYGLDAEILERMLARALQLSKEEFPLLQKWRTERHLDGIAKCDIAACVEHVLNLRDVSQ